MDDKLIKIFYLSYNKNSSNMDNKLEIINKENKKTVIPKSIDHIEQNLNILLFEIDKTKITKNVKINIIINKKKIPVIPNDLEENYFVLKTSISNNEPIDKIKQYKYYKNYLISKQMPYQKNLRKCFINTLFTSNDSKIIHLLPIIIECYDNNETDNFRKIIIAIQTVNFESIKKIDFESKKDEIINKFTDTNFITEIELENSKDDFDYFICRFNLFLSFIYLTFDEVEKFYELIINQLQIEQLILFLNMINNINLFYVFSFEIIYKIFDKIVKGDKIIPNDVFEICFKLLKDNKDKLDLIFIKINEFKKFLNDDLIDNIKSNDYDNKKKSINIKTIITFSNLKDEELEIFFNYIENNYSKLPSSKNITRYIFYIDVISIYNLIVEVTDNYEHLKQIEKYLNNNNYDYENNKALQKKIKNKEYKHINFILNKMNYSSKDYFLNVGKFLSNQKMLLEVINKNILLFSEKLFELSFNDFKLFNHDLQKFIVNIKENEVISFFANNLNKTHNISVIKEFYETFFELNENKNIVFKVIQIFTIKINNILKFHDLNKEMIDDKLLFLIESIINYNSIDDDDENKVKQNISNLFISVSSDIIFFLILSISEKDAKNLKSNFFEIFKEKLYSEDNKINKIKKYIYKIKENKEINQLSKNQIELIKNIIEIISFSPLDSNDFFMNQFTEKEDFFLYLKNLKILNLENFKQIKFIKHSIEYSNKIRELFQNKQLKINQLLKFKGFENVIFEKKLLLIYDNNDEFYNISNNIKDLDKKERNISECELIKKNFFFNCISFKYDSSLKYLKNVLKDGNISNFESVEFNEKYNEISNFVNDEIKQFKELYLSFVFLNIFNSEMIKQNKNGSFTYEEIINLLKHSYGKYCDLIDLKHDKAFFNIDEIELYFNDVNIKNEINLISSHIKKELNENEIYKINETINFIIERKKNYNNIEKFIKFLSFFKITNNQLNGKLNQLKYDFEHSFNSENLISIQNKLSCVYLQNGNDFNDFIKDLISITNLLQIIKENEIEIIKEYFNYSNKFKIKIQSIEKFHELSIIFKQMFEMEFENDNDLISYIKKNLFENEENKEKIKYSMIINQDYLTFQTLGRIINDKRIGDKVKMKSFLKYSNFTLEIKNKISESNNELYTINNIEDNYIKENNEINELWENSILFLSNYDKNKNDNVPIIDDDLNIYYNFNLIIKQIKKEIHLFTKSIQKGCFYKEKIYNQIKNGKLKIKENENEEFKDYDNYIKELTKNIEEMDLETIRLYEDYDYYKLTFFYGQQYLYLEKMIKNRNNNKEIENYFRYLTNGYKLENMNVKIDNNNKNKLQIINYFINELFKLNNLNYEIIFKDYFLCKEIKYFEPGIYYQKYNKHCQKDILIYNYYLTNNFPFNAGVLFCKNYTLLEEVRAFFYRFIQCKFRIPFYISNFSKLKNKIKRTIIELLYKKEKQNKVLNSYLIFFLKEEDEKEFNYYFQKMRYYKNEIVKFQKEKEKKIISEIKELCDSEIIDSNSVGLGKTSLIKYYSNNHKFTLVTFPFGYTNSIENIVLDLKNKNFDFQSVIIYLNIYDTQYIEVLEEFLFYLVFTSCIVHKENIFYIKTRYKIIIEIPYGFFNFVSKCEILKLILKQNVHSINIDLNQDSYLQKQLRLIDNFETLYEQKLIHKSEIYKEKEDNQKRNKNIDTLNKNFEYYFDKIKKMSEIENMNYYQFFSYINVLYSQLECFANNYYLAPKTLIQNSGKDVLESRTILYENLKEFAKVCTCPSYSDYNSKEFFGNNFELKEYSKEIERKLISDYYYKGKTITFENIPPALVLFNEDKQSISIVINHKKIGKETKQKLNYLWNSQNQPNKLEIINYDNLSQKEFREQINIFYNINKDSNINLYKDFVFTVDNYFKLLLIHIKSKANMPILLMGETGCGKTYLIQVLCAITNTKLAKLNIHAGINEKDVTSFIDNIKNIKEKIWVFFDEINTSHVIGLISEIMCNRTLKGNSLNNNFQFIAACNPYRIKKNNSNLNHYGLNINNNSNLDYNVFPIPISLLNYTFDFGYLKTDDEKKYIKEMIKNLNFNDTLLDLVINLISFSQKNFRYSDPYSVSLRDIKRFCDLYNGFIKYFKLSRVENYEQNKNIYNEKAILLSLYLNYIIRITNKMEKKDYYEKIKNIINVKGKFESKNIKEIIEEEINYLCEKMIIPKGIALTQALKENLFSLFHCILSKIPIYIIGKPGCSKSLGMEILYDSLKGELSNNDYFKKLPSLFYIYFQGSLNTTSKEVVNAFNKARNFNNNINNDKKLIPVLFFDEMGLAEKSKDNPLKVLHAELDNYSNFSVINNNINDNNNDNYVINQNIDNNNINNNFYNDNDNFNKSNNNNKKISFVGISNYFLDYSKQNRGITLFRDDLDENDLIETAKEISNCYKVKYDEDLCKALAKAYCDYKIQLPEKYKDFHSTRDFYFLIKRICEKLNENILLSTEDTNIYVDYYLKINFSGLNNSIIENYVSINSILKKNIVIPKEKEYNLENILIENINNKDSRYLLLISKNSTTDFLIEYILKKLNKPYKIFIGSQFKNDIRIKDYSIKILNQVIANIEYGNMLILKNLDIIYSSLYDLFNLHFHYLNENQNKKFVRIVINMIDIPRLYVDEDFKCIILINENEIYEKDPPFLSRFEKHIISFDIFLNQEEIDICNNIYNMFNQLFNTSKFIDLNKQKINFGKEEIYGLFYKIKERYGFENNNNIIFTNNNNDNNNSDYEKMKYEIIKILTLNLSQDIIIYAQFSNIEKQFLEIIYQNYDLIEKNNLKDFLSSLSSKKNIIYTFSLDSFNLKNEEEIKVNNISINKSSIQELYISSDQSQFDIEKELNEFYSEAQSLLFLRFDSSQNKHLNHIISLIENIEKNYNNSSLEKIIIIIVTIKRFIKLNDSDIINDDNEIIIKEKDSVSHLSEYNQIFIDNLLAEDRNIHFTQIISSNDSLLESLNLEKNMENILNQALNSLPKDLQKIKINKNSFLYDKIKSLVEEYILKLDEPIKFYLNQRIIKNNTIDIYEHLLNYFKTICQKYIIFILIILYKYDLIIFLNNNTEKELLNIIDPIIIKEKNLLNNIKMGQSSYQFENNVSYEIPFINFYFTKLNKKIINLFKTKFIKNEHFLENKKSENDLIKTQYLEKKNKIMLSLINESKLLIQSNMQLILFTKYKDFKQFENNFIKFFIHNEKELEVEIDSKEEIISLFSYIIELICNSFKIQFKNIEETNLNLIIYTSLWFECYKNSFIKKYLSNIFNFKQICKESINITEKIKTLIDSKQIHFISSINNPEMKTLCNEIIFLLNESLLYLTNKYFREKDLNHLKPNINNLNNIYINANSFQTKFLLYGNEIWKIEISKILNDNLMSDNEYKEIIQYEKLQDENYNSNDIENLIINLNDEINKLKNFKLKKNSNYDNHSLIINILNSKYKIFTEIDIRKKIFEIIMNDMKLVVASKLIFNSLITNNLNLNLFSQDEEIQILNRKNELIDFIENIETSTNIKIVYKLQIMDIFSKFILIELKYNEDINQFGIFKKFFNDILNNNDLIEDNKNLKYLFKVEYIKVYIYLMSEFIFENNNRDDNDIKNFIEFIKEENNFNKDKDNQIKIYLIKCIKHRLNNSFSNLENYNGPINWIKKFIETQKSKLLYIPMNMLYINFQEKYNKIKDEYNQYLKNNNEDMFIKDKEDCYIFTHYFYNEKASFLLKNKSRDKTIEQKLNKQLELLSNPSKSLIQCIINSNKKNYSDEKISLFILSFNIYSFFFELYDNVFNENSLIQISSFEIKNNDKTLQINDLVFSFFILVFKFIHVYLNDLNDYDNIIEMKLEETLNQLNQQIIKYENLNNAYCLIYYLLSKKINQIETNNPVEFLNQFIISSIKSIDFNKNIYQKYLDKYFFQSELNFKNPKFQILEFFDSQNININNYLYIYKTYLSYETIINKCVENQKNSLFGIIHNTKNQNIFNKIYIFIDKIKPFIKSLHQKYSKKITKVGALKLDLNKIFQNYSKLEDKFNKFKKGLKELYEIKEVNKELPLMNFIFQNDIKNEFNLYEECKKLITEFNNIFENNELFKKILLEKENEDNNTLNFFNININNIVPSISNKKKKFEINQLYDNSYRTILFDREKKLLNLSLYSNLKLKYEDIYEFFNQEYKFYLWKLPYPKKFEFCFEFENGVYNLINEFYQIFNTDLTMPEKVEIQNCIKDKKIEHFQFLSLIQHILMCWKEKKQKEYKTKLYDEIFPIIINENYDNKFIIFLQKSNLDTNKIISIYEFIEEQYFDKLIEEIPIQYQKKMNSKIINKISNFFKSNKNEEIKKKFIIILRKFILRCLISNDSIKENVDLIQSLKEINTNSDEQNILSLIEKYCEENKIQLIVENSISIYNDFKNIKNQPIKKKKNSYYY